MVHATNTGRDMGLRRALLVLAFILTACSRNGETPPPAKQVSGDRVGICQGGVVAVLPLVARSQGYFGKAGLDAEIVTKGDGKLAMEGVLSGECSFSICGEPPLVSSSFVRDDFAVLASLGSNENATKIIARSDMGISTAKDLRGKTIGVRRGTLSHFFLDQFLKKHAIGPREVSLRFLEPAALPDALANGTVAAYSATDELVFAGFKKLGDRALVLSEPGLSLASINLVARKEYLTAKPQVAKQVLVALQQAEEYCRQHPAEAREIVRRAKNLAPEEVERIFRDQTIALSLAKPLLLSLEDHARWMIEQKMVDRSGIPNLLGIIDPKPLQAIKPSAVGLDR